MLGWFDPMYFVILAPAILLGLWAQFRVKSAYHQGSQVAVRSGLSGAEAARRILDSQGLNDVAIEMTPGTLSDHYDPRQKVLRLSPDVAQGRSAASLGIAAHEAGHALQDAGGYSLLGLRNAIVPLAAVGSNLSLFLIVIGAMLSVKGFGHTLVWVGIGFFALVVLFQLVNLPVEYDASNRAKDILLRSNMVTQDEHAVVKRVLSAAALTYVAATLTAVLTLLYYVMRFGQQQRN